MNTDTHSYRDKGRALFLAAIMVSSMVAGVAVFGVAPAAAANVTISDDVTEPSYVDTAFEASGDANVGGLSPSSGDTLIEISVTDGLEPVDLNAGAFASSDLLNATLVFGNDTADGNERNDTIDLSTNSLDELQDGTGNDFDSPVFDTVGVSSAGQLILQNTTANQFNVPDLQVNETVGSLEALRIGDDGGNETEIDIDNVVQQSVGQSDGNAFEVDQGGSVVLEIEDNNQGGDQTVGTGQVVDFNVSEGDESNTFTRATGSGSDVVVVSTTSDQFDDADTFNFTTDNGAETQVDLTDLALSLDDITRDVEVNFGDDEVVSGQDVIEVSATSDQVGREVDAELTVENDDGDTVTLDSADGQINGDNELVSTDTGEPIEFDVSTLDFDTDIDANDVEAGDNATVTIEDQITGETQSTSNIQFVDRDPQAVVDVGDVVSENTGDYAFFDVSVEGEGSAEFSISEGPSGDRNYEMTATIDYASSDGGEVTVGVNTNTIDSGTLTAGEDVFVLDDTDDEISNPTVNTPASTALPDETFRVAVSAGDDSDRTQLNLQNEEFNSLTSHISPADGDDVTDGVDAFLENVQTPSDTVAFDPSASTNDTLTLLFDAGGLYGINTDGDNVASDLQATLSQSNVVDDSGNLQSAGTGGHALGVFESNTGVGAVQETSLDSATTSNGVVLGDLGENENSDYEAGVGDGNQFFVELSVSNIVDDLGINDGESVTFAHVVNVSAYDYLDASNFDNEFITVLEQEVTFEETNIEFDDIDGDDTYSLVPGEDNQTVGGSTNLAPGTEITVTVSTDANIETQTVEVTENPGFEATFDLSAFGADEELDDISAEASSVGLDAETGAEFGDVNEQNIETADQEQIAELEETIANLEEQISNLEDERDTIAEERDAIAEERDSLQDQLEQADSEISDLQSQNEDLQAQLEDAESTISDLQSQNEDLNSTVSDLESQVADLEGQLEEAQTQNESGDSDGGGPGFGVAAALVALIGAALLAVRRRD